MRVAAHFISSSKFAEKKMLNKVEVGTKLSKNDAPSYVLVEVLELLAPEGSLPHARTRVRTTSHDLGVRMYSLSALEDDRLFRPFE